MCLYLRECVLRRAVSDLAACAGSVLVLPCADRCRRSAKAAARCALSRRGARAVLWLAESSGHRARAKAVSRLRGAMYAQARRVRHTVHDYRERVACIHPALFHNPTRSCPPAKDHIFCIHVSASRAERDTLSIRVLRKAAMVSNITGWCGCQRRSGANAPFAVGRFKQFVATRPGFSASSRGRCETVKSSRVRSTPFFVKG